MSADERWLELVRANTHLADGMWDRACPTGELAQFGDGVTELIASARGPATPDEHAAEEMVVARMQEAVCGATQLEQPRHLRQRMVHRIAAAKVAAVLAVVALAAATATGATSEAISLMRGWVDDLGPRTSTDQPSSGETPAGSAGRGEAGSQIRDQRNAPSGRLGEAGPSPTAQSSARSDESGSSLGQTDGVSGEDAPDQGATQQGDSDSSPGQDGTERGRSGPTADGDGGRPLGDGATAPRGPPGQGGNLPGHAGAAPGQGDDLPGDGSVPPGLRMSPWGGANPAQRYVAAAES